MLFEGIIPAVTTPFDASGAVDRAELERNVRALLEAGVHGLVATGTMGEAASLTAAERRAVVEAVSATAAGSVHVIAGVSSSTPEQVAALAADAVAAGAGAIMLLPPLGYRAAAHEIVEWFASAARAGTPVMAYNNPEASGTDMPATLIARLAEVEGVVAVKECSGDARRIPAILEAAEGRLEVLVGGDDWALEGFSAGATGWVSGVAVVAPRECVALYEHMRAGELEAAREVYCRILPLARFDMTPKLVQYFKAAMDAVGLAGGPCRPPRMELEPAEHAALEHALRVLRAEVAV
jgi:4-hydroxy-tetrahydrodipicolinate synthase